MIKATQKDRALVVDLLTASFEQNKSVNYITGQKGDKRKRIKALMEYSFDICRASGAVFLSEDRKACALVLYPDKKKTSFKTVWLDTLLVFRSIGAGNIGKVLKRESVIKAGYPTGPMYYLWFIGVEPEAQGRGAGSQLLTSLLAHAAAQKRTIYLETSAEENVRWYQKFGFRVYLVHHFTHELYCLKKEPEQGTE